MARSKKKKQNEQPELVEPQAPVETEEIVQQAPIKTAPAEKTASEVHRALLQNYSKVTLKSRGLI
jgi:hypothetical protein